ncbi:MAG: hypothetical protein DI597_14545 [Pseudoxanthomonas spadix]|nr:MAG: hypothetical protein DI597_14545 [Pseudoxanthomonas spadix]
MPDFLFFPLIFEFLQEEINGFQSSLLGRFATLFGMLALSLLTIWVFIQGWRVMTGRSREPMMALVGDTLKAMLVIGIATGFAGNSSALYRSLTSGLGEAIYGMVTNNADQSNKDMFESINASLDATSLAMNALTAVSSAQTGGDGELEGESGMLRVMVMLGIGGPAITGGAMVLMYEVGMALFVGLGPLFIICLMFDATKQLFSRWLMYGAGMMFSLATLYVLSNIAMKLMITVAGVQWATTQFQLANPAGLREAAMQTAGLGLILTTMLITCPPMAASFFQGMLASFSPYSAINANSPQSGQPGPNGQPAGSYIPGQVGRATQHDKAPSAYTQQALSVSGQEAKSLTASASPGSKAAHPNPQGLGPS